MHFGMQTFIPYKIPGPWFIPFIGSIEIISKMRPEDITKVAFDLRNYYKKTFRLFMGPNIWIFLHSPEELKEALNNSTLKRAPDFQQLKIVLGEGLLLSEEIKWNLRRKALTPAFHQKILNNFIDQMCHHCSILVKNLENTNEQSIEISTSIFHCILDIICETSMGAEINSQNDPNCQYAKAYHDAFHILFQRMINPFLASDFIFNQLDISNRLSKSIEIIHEMTDRLIKERRQLYNKNQVNNMNENENKNNYDLFEMKKMPMLDILLSIKIMDNYLTDQEIKDEVNTFLFAGVDTTKAAICFALYNLAKYENIQNEIYNEIVSINSNNEAIKMDDIRSAKLLNQFIKESLRLHTIVPLTGRQTTCETKIGNVIYPKDTSIWINMYGVAHDENYFPHPFEFKIERFAENNEINKYSYLPFSAGPHNCIGKRYADLIMKIIIIYVIRKFEIKLKNSNEKLEIISEMVLTARNGFNLIFKKRN